MTPKSDRYKERWACAPLAGLRVLSLAEQLPGPYATLVLADLGADVVLIERPNGGDPARTLPDIFEAVARGKRSVALDLKTPDGHAAFLRLVRDADVVLEGYRPGVAARLGIGYEDVAAVNPAAVYISITGFGQDGPYRDRPAHDIVYQAVAGLLHDHVGVDGAGPPPTLPVADLAAGSFAVIAVLTGLLSRSRTGTGSYVDVGMTDVLMSWLTPMLGPAASGAPRPGLPPMPGYGLYPCADGEVLALGVTHEDHLWAPLCAAVGLEMFAQLTARERWARHDEVDGALRARLASRARPEWEVVLGTANIAFGPVYSLTDVADDPHVISRGTLANGVDSSGRQRTHVRQPLVVNGRRGGGVGRAPILGEHTNEVLAEAGFDAQEIAMLAGSGAVVQPVGP